MSVHSRDRDNEELGAIGGNKPISRQTSSSSRSSSIAIMQNLVKTLAEQMHQQHLEFMERIERASPDLNPVELRTNPGDGNFVFHAVPTHVATRPSIISDIDKETETSFRPLTSVSRSLLELNRPPVLIRRSERIRNRIMNTRGSKWNNIPFWATLSSCRRSPTA